MDTDSIVFNFFMIVLAFFLVIRLLLWAGYQGIAEAMLNVIPKIFHAIFANPIEVVIGLFALVAIALIVAICADFTLHS